MLSPSVIECATVNALTCQRHGARAAAEQTNAQHEQHVIEAVRHDVREAEREIAPGGVQPIGGGPATSMERRAGLAAFQPFRGGVPDACRGRSSRRTRTSRRSVQREVARARRDRAGQRMVATAAEASSIAGATAYAIAGRTSDASNAIVTRCRNLVSCASRDWGGAERHVLDTGCRRLQLLDQRGGIGHDFDLVGRPS